MKKSTTINIEEDLKNKADYLIKQGHFKTFVEFLDFALKNAIQQYDLSGFTVKEPVAKHVINGSVIREKRIAVNMSLKALSEKTGRHLATLSRYERGLNNIDTKDIKTIQKIAEALNINFNDLIIDKIPQEDNSMKSIRVKQPYKLNTELLGQKRIALRMNKAKFAHSLGIAQSYYLSLENGEKNIRQTNPLAQKIADAFNVPLTDLFILQ